MSTALRSRAGVTCAAAAVLAIASPVVAYLESTVAYAGSGARSGSGTPPASGPEPVQEPSSLRWLFPERPSPDVPVVALPEPIVPLPLVDVPAVAPLTEEPAAVPALPRSQGDGWTLVGAVAEGADGAVSTVQRGVDPGELLQIPVEELLLALAVDPGTPCYDELRRQVEWGELVLTGLPTDLDALASVTECSTIGSAVLAPAGSLLAGQADTADVDALHPGAADEITAYRTLRADLG